MPIHERTGTWEHCTMNGAPTAKPPQFNPKSPLLEEAGSQPPTSRILRESKPPISRPRGWQGQPEVINFLRLPPPVCVYFRQRQIECWMCRARPVEPVNTA